MCIYIYIHIYTYTYATPPRCTYPVGVFINPVCVRRTSCARARFFASPMSRRVKSHPHTDSPSSSICICMLLFLLEHASSCLTFHTLLPHPYMLLKPHNRHYAQYPRALKTREQVFECLIGAAAQEGTAWQLSANAFVDSDCRLFH